MHDPRHKLSVLLLESGDGFLLLLGREESRGAVSVALCPHLHRPPMGSRILVLELFAARPR